ncbi:GvpL/GvpF family gas vesicle protein [Chloroflexales bacterium ZM16-3]|nr:GvpL/GvpF family gas vesicle protein [Chloroflexales bacterium ZM16-3]
MTPIIDEPVELNAEALQAALEQVAYYTYAIARRKPGASPDAKQIVGVDPHHSVQEIAQGDLLALVSAVSLAEYDLSVLESRLQDRNWLEVLAMAHQRVMTELLDSYTLLPLKLCTLYTDKERARAALADNAEQFRAALDRIEGAVEWGVKAYCDKAALAAWAAHSAPELSQLASSVAAASPGARYMLEKRLQRAAQQASDDLRRNYAQASHSLLLAQARAAEQSPLQPAQIHGRSDDMVLNGAYLVDTAGEAGFAAALDELRTQYEPCGFSFVLTGPWPAYSFSTGGGAGDA